MTQTTSTTPRRRRYLAVRKTWHATARVERVVARRRIPVSTPAGLIAAAAALVPDWEPLSVYVVMSDTDNFFVLEFGALEQPGVTTSVEVQLGRDAPMLALTTYILTRTTNTLCTAIGWFPPPDDDGGDELPVPSLDMVTAPLPVVGHPLAFPLARGRRRRHQAPPPASRTAPHRIGSGPHRIGSPGLHPGGRNGKRWP